MVPEAFPSARTRLLRRPPAFYSFLRPYGRLSLLSPPAFAAVCQGINRLRPCRRASCFALGALPPRRSLNRKACRGF